MKPAITVTIASLPDREELVAEIMYGNVQWCELSQEKGRLMLEFYPHPAGQPWKFGFDDTINALQDAKRKLMGE